MKKARPGCKSTETTSDSFFVRIVSSYVPKPTHTFLEVGMMVVAVVKFNDASSSTHPRFNCTWWLLHDGDDDDDDADRDD